MRGRHFLSATALAVVTAVGFGPTATGTPARAQTADSGLPACVFEQEVDDKLLRVRAEISDTGEMVLMEFHPARHLALPEARRTGKLIFFDPGTPEAKMSIKLGELPDGSSLQGTRVRWKVAGRTHDPIITLIEDVSQGSIGAPSFLVPDTARGLEEGIEVLVYHPGSSLNGFADEEFLFDTASIRQAMAIGAVEIVRLRQRVARQQCDPQPIGGCFLTSAAVGLLGRPDDCWELQALRQFRDGWLSRQAGGPDLITEYYRTAPAMAAQLERQPAKLARLYLGTIVPAALAARLGCNRLANHLYSRMVRKLA